jgi:hypothetical protein
VNICKYSSVDRRDPRVRVAADFLKRVASGPQGLS